jgi:hypothetical protein
MRLLPFAAAADVVRLTLKRQMAIRVMFEPSCASLSNSVAERALPEDSRPHAGQGRSATV